MPWLCRYCVQADKGEDLQGFHLTIGTVLGSFMFNAISVPFFLDR